MKSNRRLLPILILLLVCFPVTAATFGYGSVVEDLVDLFSPSIGDKAVAFASMNSDSDGFSNRFIHDVESGLINSDCIVLERSNLDSIISEMKFQTSGLVDDSTAVSIGHMVGADYLIVGSAQNMVDHYRVEVRLMEIQTGVVRRQKSYDLKYDSELKGIIAGRTSGVGTKGFLISTRLGCALEINRAHDDMVGTGVTPEEKSNNSLMMAATIGLSLPANLKLNAEAGFYLNNGYRLSGMGDDVAISYKTFDIPVFLSWSFIESPFEASVYGGAYASFSISDATFNTDDGSASVSADGHVLGVLAGLNVSRTLGVCSVSADLRYIHDFGTLIVTGDFGEGEKQYGLCLRKGIVASLGILFAL